MSIVADPGTQVSHGVNERPLGRTRRTGRASPLALVLTAAISLLLLAAIWAPVEAQSLRGSPHSLKVQNEMARLHDYTYIATPRQLDGFVAAGYLVRIQGNRDFRIHSGVSYPYARETVRTFLQRLGSQYRSACGEQLVVTSLTRPKSRQPRNASPHSVHPTGMAVDLRRSKSSRCRAWLERVLLSLEGQGVLEATREYWPPHYHVALFPEPYRTYVASLENREDAPSSEGFAGEYLVRAGDSLWKIAQSTGVSVVDLRVANELSTNRIHPGQRLRIPDSGIQLASAGYDYRVQRGDSLWDIAQAHSTSVHRIRAENGLQSDRIRPGQVLTVPVGQ
jgi:LysM repeat protein